VYRCDCFREHGRRGVCEEGRESVRGIRSRILVPAPTPVCTQQSTHAADGRPELPPAVPGLHRAAIGRRRMRGAPAGAEIRSPDGHRGEYPRRHDRRGQIIERRSEPCASLDDRAGRLTDPVRQARYAAARSRPLADPRLAALSCLGGLSGSWQCSASRRWLPRQLMVCARSAAPGHHRAAIPRVRKSSSAASFVDPGAPAGSITRCRRHHSRLARPLRDSRIQPSRPPRSAIRLETQVRRLGSAIQLRGKAAVAGGPSRRLCLGLPGALCIWVRLTLGARELPHRRRGWEPQSGSMTHVIHVRGTHGCRATVATWWRRDRWATARSERVDRSRRSTPHRDRIARSFPDDIAKAGIPRAHAASLAGTRRSCDVGRLGGAAALRHPCR
jgi:hypothetical protein